MDIYEQHQKAFNRTSAYVIAKEGERMATVAIKYPADGAGRLYAYVHWIGVEMVRGSATGGGYDKATAACASAVVKIDPGFRPKYAREDIQTAVNEYRAFLDAMALDDGPSWIRALEEAGFTVWQAV